MATITHGEGTTVVDVRDDLRHGREPFMEIMKALREMPQGNAFVLYATFKPEPLIDLLAGEGFEHAAQELPDGSWSVRFERRSFGG